MTKLDLVNPELIVVAPSRGRPAAAMRLTQAFAETCTADTLLAFAVDNDDPTLEAYRAVVDHDRPAALLGDEHSTMVEALNDAATAFARSSAFAIGFLGDDHQPRTKGWDQRYLEALHELGTGMVYGDDLIQGANLPTQIAMTSDIITALGYMAPPPLVHLYVDNWWLQLGVRAGCIRYLPDVVVEHLHPVAGKAEWDEGHRRVNAPALYQSDAATFARLEATELPAAVAKVKALR